MKLIQKNLNQVKGPEKLAKGDFAKKYATIDKAKEVAPERYDNSELVNQAAADVQHVEKL